MKIKRVISVVVQASHEVHVPQKYEFPWGRRVLGYVRSQTPSGKERMGDLGDKLLGWDVQNLASTPRGRKISHQCHEIQFSALDTVPFQKSGCFVLVLEMGVGTQFAQWEAGFLSLPSEYLMLVVEK